MASSKRPSNSPNSPDPSSKSASPLSTGRSSNTCRQSQWLQKRINAHAPMMQALENRFHLKQDEINVTLENMANPALKALTLASLLQSYQQPVVVITADPQHSLGLYRDLIELIDRDQVVLYPAEDISPYDLATVPIKTLKQQVAIAEQFEAQRPQITLIAAKSLVIKHLAPKALWSHALTLKVKQTIAPSDLATQCLERGYVKASIILEPGEFSNRGDIFDLYPVNGNPVRIEFFGDIIETIRVIDIETQRSVEKIDSVSAIPSHWLLLSPDNKQALIDAMQSQLTIHTERLDPVDAEALRITVENQISALAQSFMPDGLDYYTPLLDDRFETLIDQLPDNSLIVYDDWAMIANNLEGFTDRLTRQYEENVLKGRMLDINFRYHVDASPALKQLKTKLTKRLYLDNYPVGDTYGTTIDTSSNNSILTLPFEAPHGFKADLSLAAKAFKEQRQEGFQIFVTTDSPQRVLDSCKEWDVPAQYVPDDGLPLKDFIEGNLDVLVSKTGLTEGFLIPDAKLIHYTDTELLGRRQKKLVIKSASANKRDDMETIKAIDELREGDFVVHAKHGIGRFVKLAQIQIDGQKREYLTIQYAGNDKLHVPAEQVKQLSRYRGSGDHPPKLNKMGGIDWGKTKTKVQKSIRSIARELTELYAVRARARGFSFDPDSPWQVELEEAFPYVETPDQWQAICDTKENMESDKPMDRLICGDVGFGKTEVAVRAIFKAVLSGKQVAVLVPTTILAQQHFNTISERFKAYPVKVGLLSRFRSPKEQKEVVDRLVVGECDVVVGTHRLLQKDVRFKDLGLVVIDEEHRFGVSHKEKLKQLRKEVDVLTLSATPIPRTLYMSISGVRDMSLINTPPVNRLPVKTYVGPYNPAQVRMAILSEIDRGGQVYFLHNRVQTIYAKLEELQQLVPEVRFGVGHGQLNEHDLENVMLEFGQQQYDVLLCTTIIESGLDIPSANTMIVDRADRFGLAQLYQIRGRVGRSDVQAYAYCYYDQDQILTQDAQQRLRAIREFTSLGSGYQIAMRDLEIRGVGNILGSEQHGHMVAVGFDMYCDMLQESIEELQGNIRQHRDDAIIDINVTAFIPDEWVGDKNVKLTEYKRLADINSNRALDIIQAEWRDRFGEIPEPTLQLVQLVKLRIQATELGIPWVREDEEHLKIAIPYTLQEWLKIQATLPPDIGKKARWVPGMTAKVGSTPTLLVKQGIMKGKDQLAFLATLFDRIQAFQQKQAEAATAK